ncbi:MAG TPA: DUF2314 domain-containing protein [Steroidobacteraceae bacterium]|nr:DUF2314 domain-containing protein [Steroidobacteraceae bacterium]
MKPIICAGFALVVCLGGATPVRAELPPAGEDGVVFMGDEHPVMARAFARAKAGLDEFLTLAQAPGRNHVGFALKVGLDTGDGTEYVWIVDFRSDKSGKFSGTINNDVEMTRKWKLGDVYSFHRDDIVDWIYFDRETRKMHGNYTLCALLTEEKPEEAARVKAEYKLDCDF